MEIIQKKYTTSVHTRETPASTSSGSFSEALHPTIRQMPSDESGHYREQGSEPIHRFLVGDQLGLVIEKPALELILKGVNRNGKKVAMRPENRGYLEALPYILPPANFCPSPDPLQSYYS